jgi:hypothetical protein
MTPAKRAWKILATIVREEPALILDGMRLAWTSYRIAKAMKTLDEATLQVQTLGEKMAGRLSSDSFSELKNNLQRIDDDTGST